jgi:hypothetical protein
MNHVKLDAKNIGVFVFLSIVFIKTALREVICEVQKR